MCSEECGGGGVILRQCGCEGSGGDVRCGEAVGVVREGGGGCWG